MGNYQKYYTDLTHTVSHCTTCTINTNCDEVLYQAMQQLVIPDIGLIVIVACIVIMITEANISQIILSQDIIEAVTYVFIDTITGFTYYTLLAIKKAVWHTKSS